MNFNNQNIVELQKFKKRSNFREIFYSNELKKKKKEENDEKFIELLKEMYEENLTEEEKDLAKKKREFSYEDFFIDENPPSKKIKTDSVKQSTYYSDQLKDDNLENKSLNDIIPPIDDIDTDDELNFIETIDKQKFIKKNMCEDIFTLSAVRKYIVEGNVESFDKLRYDVLSNFNDFDLFSLSFASENNSFKIIDYYIDIVTPEAIEKNLFTSNTMKYFLSIVSCRGTCASLNYFISKLNKMKKIISHNTFITIANVAYIYDRKDNFKFIMAITYLRHEIIENILSIDVNDISRAKNFFTSDPYDSLLIFNENVFSNNKLHKPKPWLVHFIIKYTGIEGCEHFLKSFSEFSNNLPFNLRNCINLIRFYFREMKIKEFLTILKYTKKKYGNVSNHPSMSQISMIYANFIEACLKNDLNTANMYLESSLLNMTKDNNIFSIKIACRYNSIDVLKLLLKKTPEAQSLAKDLINDKYCNRYKIQDSDLEDSKRLSFLQEEKRKKEIEKYRLLKSYSF